MTSYPITLPLIWPRISFSQGFFNERDFSKLFYSDFFLNILAFHSGQPMIQLIEASDNTKDTSYEPKQSYRVKKAKNIRNSGALIAGSFELMQKIILKLVSVEQSDESLKSLLLSNRLIRHITLHNPIAQVCLISKKSSVKDTADVLGTLTKMPELFELLLKRAYDLAKENHSISIEDALITVYRQKLNILDLIDSMASPAPLEESKRLAGICIDFSIMKKIENIISKLINRTYLANATGLVAMKQMWVRVNVSQNILPNQWDFDGLSEVTHPNTVDYGVQHSFHQYAESIETKIHKILLKYFPKPDSVWNFTDQGIITFLTIVYQIVLITYLESSFYQKFVDSQAITLIRKQPKLFFGRYLESRNNYVINIYIYLLFRNYSRVTLSVP